MSKLREILTSQQDVIESLRSQIISWKEQNNQLHGQLKSIENLEKLLEAAKLREAELQREWAGAIADHTVAGIQLVADKLALTRERDAALSALGDAREGWNQFKGYLAWATHITVNEHELEYCNKAHSADPSAALAERDRAIEKRTAERCAELADSAEQADYIYLSSAAIRGEFGLEPKTEGA